MNTKPYITIPTWNNGTWEYTGFSDKKEFREYVKSLFKVPGEYAFDETVLQWNIHARTFNEKGIFCVSPEGSRDHQTFWDTEKEKCRKGVIFKNNGKEWYLPRDYYMWVNYLPIYDKVKNKFAFPDIWDSQYHASLYDMLAYLHSRHSIKLKKRQWGSEQPHSEPVLSEKGWITMGEIEVGTKLWNPDGTITNVTHIFPNGEKDVYSITFSDGRVVRCGIDHNWEVYDRYKKEHCIITTKTLVENGVEGYPTRVGSKQYKTYRYAVKQIVPIDFSIKKDPSINPYLLGILIGDGSINKRISFTTMDEFIVKEIQEILGSDYKLVPENKKNNRADRYSISFPDRKKYSHIEDFKYGVNPIIRQLKELGLSGTVTKTKFIPTDCQLASLSYRISLLQGLMDSDGYVNNKGLDIHYTSSNKILAEGVLLLCRSLGIITSLCSTVVKDVEYYRVRLSGSIDVDIFRLPRKLDRFKKRKADNKITHKYNPIIGIKKEDYKELSSCIIVDNPNHLYITRDFVVTHNTYLHIAKVINRFWFEEGFTAKLGASLKDYINEKGAWKFLTQYKDFLNKNTAWYRTIDPDRIFSWQQRQKVRENDRDSYIGLKSSISGTSFEKDATAGVGGNINLFYHEEAGIAPKMDTTYEFMRPALSSGGILTGMFMAAGSVGDLDQCIPMKRFMMSPDEYDFYGVETNLIDDAGNTSIAGLFIPEQWSMAPHIDQWGNSLVEDALEDIRKQREQWRKTLDPTTYQLRISQKPINIKEAFAIRKVSLFPIKYTVPQTKRIEQDEYALEYVELERNKDNKIITKPCDRLPNKYPTEEKLEDKRGVVVIHEHPIKEAKALFTYLGSVDPVAKGAAKNSSSLADVRIWKMPVQVTKKFQDGTKETFMEGGKLVAWWTGRYEDIVDTNECISMLVEYYQAYTTCEINQGSWVDYMRLKRRTRYLALKEDMTFDAETGIKQGTIYKYGWYNTTAVWNKMLEYGINSLSNVVSCDYDHNDVPINIKYGVERIPDIWLLKEMQEYDPKDGNFDRVISYCALMAFAELRMTLIGGVAEVERKEDTAKELANKENLYTFNERPHPFRNLMGGNMSNKYKGYKRSSPFKHLR